MTCIEHARLLTTVMRLELRKQCIEDLTPLQDLVQLQVLDLTRRKANNQAHAHFSDLAPLRKLRSLVELRLCGADRVSDVAPLSGLTRLRTLDLSHTKVADVSPLRHLASLEDLQLAETAVRDVTPLYGLTKLRKLSLP